jgi:hypothetical protein
LTLFVGLGLVVGSKREQLMVLGSGTAHLLMVKGAEFAATRGGSGGGGGGGGGDGGYRDFHHVNNYRGDGRNEMRYEQNPHQDATAESPYQKQEHQRFLDDFDDTDAQTFSL